jgi:hypothetical protein
MMSNWQLTATTVLCAATGREVTIIVYKNDQPKCTGAFAPSTAKKSSSPACSAESCKQVSDYSAKLDAEECSG